MKLAEANLAIVTRRVHIQYLSMATWGETLNISTQMLNVKDTGGSDYVSMTRADRSPVTECILDWELIDRKSGAARPLSGGLG